MEEQGREYSFKFLLIICIIFSAVLLIINYFTYEKIIKNEIKLSYLEKNKVDIKENSKNYQYSDIINLLKSEEGMKIIKIDDKKDKKITDIEIENNWDVVKTSNILRNIQIKDKSINVSKLSIERDKENNVNTKINMEIEKY